MKLSELLAYYNHLCTVDLDEYRQKTLGPSQDILSKISRTDLQFPATRIALEIKNEKLMEECDGFILRFNELRDGLLKQCLSFEREYLEHSSKVFYRDLEYYKGGHLTDEFVLHKGIKITQESKNIFHTRLRANTSWEYPGMILRPGLETWINDIVANDPMYIVDINHQMLQYCLPGFTEEYQRRLRPYTIDELTPGELLGQFPKEQFGLCLAYNYFNFRPLELIKKYIMEFYALLRPGGKLIFTFNNCDIEQGVDLAEREYMAYTPGHLLYEYIEQLGFRIEFTRNQEAFTWVEISKPGVLETIRGGQAIAKIIPI